MNREQKRYSLEIKHEVCRLYMRGGYTKTQLQNRYGITGKSRLLSWLRQLGYVEEKIKPERFLAERELVSRQDSESKEIQALKAKLLDAELKAEAYQRMIAMAEKKYKIEIKKKNDTK